MTRPNRATPSDSVSSRFGNWISSKAIGLWCVNQFKYNNFEKWGMELRNLLLFLPLGPLV